MNADLIHLSFYRFYDAGDTAALQSLRVRLRAICTELDLKGTFLLSHEGVNAMLSGARTSVESFKSFAREVFGVSDRDFKVASVANDAFHRLLVKIKKEIISVGDTGLRPHEQTAQRLSPAELKTWLDEGRPMILLDTRNRYEIEVGTFNGAEELQIDHSRQFAAKAAKQLEEQPEKWNQVPVVTFCTGGIRCEKASAVLQKLGLRDVYQLDGGILRYFEENGAAHFSGECFVFDWRLAVNGDLKPVDRAVQAGRLFGRHVPKID